MSKAVLVIDMPSTCEKCPLKEDDKLPTACVFRRWHSLSINETPETNNWCPLKPLPRKLTEADISWGEQRGYRGGWNNCLAEITGETE